MECLCLNILTWTINQLKAKNSAEEVLVHSIYKQCKRFICLGLILNQRITLTKTAKTNTRLQVIHLLEVCHPASINNAKHYLSSKLSHDFFTELLGFLVKGFLNECSDILFKLLKLSVLGKLWKISLTSEFREPLLKTLKIPLISISVAKLLANTLGSGRSNRLNEFHKIFAIKNLVSLCINNLALLIHNIVVIKDVLTHCKVNFLNLALSAFNKLSNNLCLDWHIVRKLIALHHCRNAVHAISAKTTH